MTGRRRYGGGRPPWETPQRGLFGDPARARSGEGGGSARVKLRLFAHRPLEQSWLLSDSGQEADAQPVPVSQLEAKLGLKRGDWCEVTLPLWLAKSRGWA